MCDAECTASGHELGAHHPAHHVDHGSTPALRPALPGTATTSAACPVTRAEVEVRPRELARLRQLADQLLAAVIVGGRSSVALSGAGLEVVVASAEHLHQPGMDEESLFAERHLARHAQCSQVRQAEGCHLALGDALVHQVGYAVVRLLEAQVHPFALADLGQPRVQVVGGVSANLRMAAIFQVVRSEVSSAACSMKCSPGSQA